MKPLTHPTSEAPANIIALIPGDLAAWLDDATLAAAAREAADFFYWVEAGDDDDHPPFGGCACPLRKLALVTYCCARGIHAAEDIAADPTGETFPAMGAGLASITRLQPGSGGPFPTDTLQLFRSHNSELIKLCLIRMLEQAWTAKHGTVPRRDYLAAEAGRRLQLACSAGSSSRDGREAEGHAGCEILGVKPGVDTSPVTSFADWDRFAAAACLIFAATILAAFPCEITLAESNFDDPATGIVGWQGINNDGGRETLEWLANPIGDGGYIQLREDAGDSATMLFLAPAFFLGELAPAYGGRLEFRLRQFRTDQFYSGADVTMVSGDVRLNYSFGRIPGTDWEQFNVPLTEGMGWSRNGLPATRGELQQVLGALERLILRGEFSSRQAERTGLDDVQLIAGPPRLNIALVGPELLISWPSQYSDWQIESSTQPANGWTEAMVETLEVGGTMRVQVPATESGQFFRLVCGGAH